MKLDPEPMELRFPEQVGPTGRVQFKHGGVYSMPADAIGLPATLRELDVDEVPLTFQVSIEGTALAGADPLAPLEMLRIIAAYRLFLPRPNIFIAAGRMHLGQLLPMMFSAGDGAGEAIPPDRRSRSSCSPGSC